MTIQDPRDIPGLLAWYSAEAMTGLADGAAMTQWDDLSGNGNHATAGGGLPPQWQASTGSAGGPAVRFRGAHGTTATTWGYFALPAGIMGAAAAGEIFAHIKSDGADCAHWWFGGQTGGSSSGHYPFSGTIYEGFGTNSRKTLGAPVLTITSWRRFNVWAAPADFAARLDDQSQYATGSNTVLWTNAPVLGHGGRNGALSDNVGSFKGHMSAVVLYNRKLTVAERADLDAWLIANPSGGVILPEPPTGLTQDAATDSTVDVSWTAPATGPAPTGYDVRVDGGTPTAVAGTAHTVTGLLPDTDYLVEVRSVTAAGASEWVPLLVTSGPAPPPFSGAYDAHLRVGTHVWDIDSAATPPGYGPLAGLRFGWSARPDDGWPTQPPPTLLVFGVVVEAGTDFDDVDQGTVVHFTFTPHGYADPLVEFGGTVRDLIARPHPRGMVYEMTAVDHLQALQEDYYTSAFIASGSVVTEVWTQAVMDADGGGFGEGTRPALPDPLAGDLPPGHPAGSLGADVSLDGPTWNILTSIAANYTGRGTDLTLRRVILSYQLDGAGDLDAAHPFHGTWMTAASAADPVVVPGSLLATQGTEWSRPRLEPNRVHVDPEGASAIYVRPHTGVDVTRVMNYGAFGVSDFTNPGWVLEGLEGADQWSTDLRCLAYLDPARVAGWLTLPDALDVYVQCLGIDERHTPTGSGELTGTLAGASLVIPPGGNWFVTFSLRRTQPDPG